MEYTEYYDLFKKYPEWEIEHEDHKEGFEGKGNDDLEKAILGELKIEQEGGEIVEISDWKPEIIKD